MPARPVVKGRRALGYNSSSIKTGNFAMTIQRHHMGARISEMVVHNGTVYLAGQVANDPSLDATGQAREVLANIDRLLGEVGSNKTKILSATIYLANIADFAAMICISTRYSGLNICACTVARAG